MASFTRVNGLGHAHGTQYNTAQIVGMEIDAIVSLATKGGVGSTIEAIAQEFNPLMMKSAGTAGKILMVVDGHGQTAASMQERLQALGTVDSIDLSSATVTARDLDDYSVA